MQALFLHCHLISPVFLSEIQFLIRPLDPPVDRFFLCPIGHPDGHSHPDLLSFERKIRLFYFPAKCFKYSVIYQMSLQQDQKLLAAPTADIGILIPTTPRASP